MRIGFLRALDGAVEPRKAGIAPTCFAYLASYLEKYGGYDDFFISDEVEELLAKKPDIVGINAYTQTFAIASRAAALIKKTVDIPVIIGGPHITALPKSLPAFVDAGVIGEGEQTFLELVNLYKNDKFTSDNLPFVNGVVYHNENAAKVTCGRQIIKNIDDVPTPRIDLFNYYDGPHFTYSIHTSRGCPYKCTFCAAGGITVKTRYHSPERVITDIENIARVKKSGLSQNIIYITDDLFALNKRRIEQIVRLIRENGLHKEFGFTCHARADIFTREMALLLKDMNMLYVSFGLESGSDNVLKSLKAESCNVKKNQRALDICKEMNIGTGAYFMVGSPDETVEDMAKTYWFIANNKNHLNGMDVTQTTPLPGTPLWDYAVKTKKVDPENLNYDNFDFGLRIGDLVFINEHYSKEFLEESYRKFRRFRREVIMKRASTEQKFGFLGSNDVGQFEGQIVYENNIYQELLGFIPENVNTVLEINKNYKILQRMTNRFEVTYLKPGTCPQENLKKYDLILFSHSLECTRNYENYIEEIIKYGKEGCFYIFLIYNSQFIENIIDSLTGDFDYNVYGLKQFENINRLSLPVLYNFLDKNNISINGQINYRLNSEKYPTETVNSIKNLLGRNEIHDYFSFIILGQRSKAFTG